LACGLLRAAIPDRQGEKKKEAGVPDLKRAGGGALHEARADIGGFKKFLLRGNVVDLAVGVVIGAAFGQVVQAVVKDILNPIIGAVSGKADVSTMSVALGGINFPVGDLIQAIISFILIALVVYFIVVLPVNKLMDHYKPQPEPAPTKECPECTSKIPQPARRCPTCAAQLLPPSQEVADAMRQVAAPSGADIADHAAKVLADRLTGQPDSGVNQR
jgi:large conductance mechanosensitive channel